jgi:hypothetical protein
MTGFMQVFAVQEESEKLKFVPGSIRKTGRLPSVVWPAMIGTG